MTQKCLLLKASGTNTKVRFFTAIFLSALLPASTALADPVATPAPDKSQYDFFNPTPDGQLRSFCTDRPTKSNLPCTVDAGHFQYEADVINWTHNNTGNTVQDTYLYPNPTFKLGLTNNSDLELNIAPLETITTHNKITGVNTNQTGNGDLYTRVKYNLIGNDSGDIAATLLPYVKIPTAEPGIGNKTFEEGLIVPVSFALPHNFSLLFDPEVDNLKNANDGGHHGNYQGLVNVSHTVFNNDITAYGELWSDINEDPAGHVTQTSLDFAVTWLVRPTLQLDIGANVGLNPETPGFQAYTGISQRF